MAIPYYCKKCRDVIGVEPEEITAERVYSNKSYSTILDIDCPGRGNHPEPKRTERARLFGLIKQIFLEYPETHTTSSWEEYAGLPSKFLLWCAIVFGSKRYPNGSYAGVIVNGKWAWWDLKMGFYGEGVDELFKLHQK
jgi:hypothetical protein